MNHWVCFSRFVSFCYFRNSRQLFLTTIISQRRLYAPWKFDIWWKSWYSENKDWNGRFSTVEILPFRLFFFLKKICILVWNVTEAIAAKIIVELSIKKLSTRRKPMFPLCSSILISNKKSKLLLKYGSTAKGHNAIQMFLVYSSHFIVHFKMIFE